MPNKKTPRASYGGFLLTFESGRTQWLAERLHPDTHLSESFSSEDWELEMRELMFLVLDPHLFSISALALMERMQTSGGFRKLKMRASQLHIFDVPVGASELGLSKLKTSIGTPERMQRLTPATWSDLLTRLKNARPVDGSSIDAIVAMRESERRLLGQTNRIERLNEQRDGLGLALDIGHLDRSAVFGSLKTDKADRANSILDLLDAIPEYERSMVEHDAQLFRKLLGKPPTRSALFGEEGRHSVRALVTDRTDLETVLGIDLILYHQPYDAYLMLQYKRMEKVRNGWAYGVKPSSNLHEQLQRMKTFQAKAMNEGPDAPMSTLWSYRLNEDPFYFKFCEQVRDNSHDSSLLPGLTISAQHLDEFLGLPEAQGGENGGLCVGYRNCPRYFNNTEFIQLAQSGWIGAGERSTALMTEVLAANQQKGRAAMLAVIDGPKDTSASGRGWKA